MKNKPTIKNPSDVESRGTNISSEGRYLIDVLRAFLNESEPPRPPEDFKEGRFIRLVEAQKTVGIVADELEKRPEFFSERLRGVLKTLRAKEAVRDVAFQLTRGKIDAEFEANGIRYLPLKGAIMKGLYPQSYQRYSCDYDVLVDESEIQRAQTLLKEKLGYRDESMSSQHYCLVSDSNQTTVELHHVLCGRFDTPVFSDPWARATPVEDARSQKTLQYRLTLEDFYLYMVLHLARHWLYYESTIRMFVDVWLFNRKYGGKYDRASLDEPLRYAGSLAFVQNVEHACRVWFDGAESDELVEAMANRLFNPKERKFGAELDPTLPQNKFPFRFIEVVLCLDYFEAHRLDYNRLPLGKRVLWIISRWLERTAGRLRKGGVFRKFGALWSNRDVFKDRLAEERAFGLTEVSRGEVR